MNLVALFAVLPLGIALLPYIRTKEELRKLQEKRHIAELPDDLRELNEKRIQRELAAQLEAAKYQ